MFRAARELGALLEEVADVDWSHPSWWGLVGGTVLLEALTNGRRLPDEELYAEYLAANGGPDADTFMGRAVAAAVDRIERAVARARAARATLLRHAESFPGQSLRSCLAWQRGWLRRRALADDRHVAIVGPERVYLLDVESPQAAAALAAALAGRPSAACEPIDRDGLKPTPAAVAVGLGDFPAARVRHLHRLAWTRGGGPWLGLGDAPPLAVVTTCHLAVDGFGHALLSRDLLDRAVEPDGTAPSPPELARPPEDRHAAPIDFAVDVLTGDARFSSLAWAFGGALERRHPPPPGARFAPSFQFSLTPGERDDPERRRRRILHGLLALRRGEAFADFRARVPGVVAREAAAAGALTRVLRAVTGAPLPPALRRRVLERRHGALPRLPPARVLSGRGTLGSLRFPDGEAPAAPLYAVSTAPGMMLTIVHHGASMTASACGAGARDFLDEWKTRLASSC